MFRNAYKKAREFTLPVILSRQRVGGDCYSQIGAFILLNDEGWIATSFHIIDQILNANKAEQSSRQYEAQSDAIKNDASIGDKERKKRLQQLKRPAKSDLRRGSTMWGVTGGEIKEYHAIPQGDIGVGRLEPFTPRADQIYPVFKDPTKDFEPGVSLCKLGFPFHPITPIWHEAKNSFELPPGAIPLPLFPIEGIFTRIAEVQAAGVGGLGFPINFIETSTAGIPGQSGGPIFDTDGAIWGVQCFVRSMALSVDALDSHGKKTPQFLNFGYGTHVATLIALCNKNGVKLQIA